MMIKDIIEILKDSYKKNWITPRDGNISYKPCNSNNFTITPSGLRKQELIENDFVNIGFSEKKWIQLNNKHLKPSGEIELHFEIVRSIEKDICVIHLHPTYTIAAMYSGVDLSKLATDFPELKRYTRISKYIIDADPLSKDLAVKGRKCLHINALKDWYDFDIVGIHNHGVISIGKNPYEAYEHIERLEHICKIFLASK